jgi:hypothetical protein
MDFIHTQLKGGMTMRVYNELKDQYEKAGYTPFICIVKWTPEQETTFLDRWSKLYATPEGEGIKGVHTWNLIGRNTLFFIGWMNSHVSLQKFCTSITHGTGLNIDVCPAIDHFDMKKALKELKSLLPNIPVPKKAGGKRTVSKAKK